MVRRLTLFSTAEILGRLRLRFRRRPAISNRVVSFHDLLFLVFFWKTARKTSKKARISFARQIPKILGKEGKKLKIAGNSLKRNKARKPQGKEKKIRPRVAISNRRDCDYAIPNRCDCGYAIWASKFPPLNFCPKAFLRGGVCYEALCGRNFIHPPPLCIHPSPAERCFLRKDYHQSFAQPDFGAD